MKNQKLASEDPYASTKKRTGTRAFDTLSRILVALICAALLFFALLLAPHAFGSLFEDLIVWSVAGLAAVVAFIVAVGLIQRLTD